MTRAPVGHRFDPKRPAPAGRQRGWAGLIGLLIALLIVAWLGRTLLVRLLPQETTMSKSKHAGNRVPGGASPADVDVTTATPAPRNELERARGLESAVRDQAADLSKRIDDQAK
jgi:hypothetical protein